MTRSKSVATREVYSKLADCLLALKAQGASAEQMAEALVQAASETGVRRAHISEAYNNLNL